MPTRSLPLVQLVRWNPGALGRIIDERYDHGLLYTVRLDKVAWPGGSDRDDARSECRFVDLREEEFVRITVNEHRRLTERAAPIKSADQKRARDAANSRAFRARQKIK